MTGSYKQVVGPVASIIAALLLATVAFSSTFSSRVPKNELLIDAIGIASLTLLVIAATLLYPLRSEMRFRLLRTFAILMAVVVGFEFLGGLLWLLLDKLVRYEQKR